MSWYRTYRPQTVADLHLVDVRQQFQNMLKSGELPQVFLFTGPKGTGKTSSARILAKVLNCEKNANHKPGSPYHEPCMKCEQCLAITKGSAMNVVEIDAASHRGIDNIRELREQVYYPPAQGEKLVYIIDEVHMLTKEAFNALLKILEEPPEHAAFFLATTESQKVIDTIVSRSTVVQFHSAANEEITTALQDIAKQEKLKVDDDVWSLITQHAQGSFRDGVKIFEQIVRQTDGKKITADQVEKLLVSFSDSDAEQLIQDVLAKDEQAIARFFQQISQQQFDARYLHAQILRYLHTELLKAMEVEDGEAIASVTILQYLLKHLSAITIDDRTVYPWLPLELCLLEMVLKSKKQGAGSKVTEEQSNKVAKLQRDKAAEGQSSKDTEQQSNREVVRAQSSDSSSQDQRLSVNAEPDVIRKVSPVVSTANADLQQVDGNMLHELWSDFLHQVRKQNFSLEALLRSSRFSHGEQGKVVIEVFYKFHKEQLELDRHKRILEDCLISQLGGLVKVEFILATPVEKRKETNDDNVSGKVEEEGLVKLAEEALL